jgi:phosphonopyruvate decarboxylase
MIEARDYIEAARAHGFSWYAGVPCSFLTPFINYVIGDNNLRYISAANEGDAVAAAAGAAIGGTRAVAMMQNSGLGNAVSPLTSLTWVFRIPLLIICTHRGEPGLTDEPQHELMGQITEDLFRIMQVPFETFPAEPEQIATVLNRADEYLSRERRPYALIMKKGTVAKHALQRAAIDFPPRGEIERKSFYQPSSRSLPSRQEALRRIVKLTPEDGTVLIATTGYTGRELYALDDRPNQLYMVGSMGCSSALGLGLALSRPDLRVVVIDGDGAALMRMGNLATCGTYGPSNLIHLVLDNEVHDSTGAQSTVSGEVCFGDIAASCGYSSAYHGDSLDLLDALFAAQPGTRARFGHLKIRPGTIADLPRPGQSPAQVLKRLQDHIGTVLK